MAADEETTEWTGFAETVAQLQAVDQRRITMRDAQWLAARLQEYADKLHLGADIKAAGSHRSLHDPDGSGLRREARACAAAVRALRATGTAGVGLGATEEWAWILQHVRKTAGSSTTSLRACAQLLSGKAREWRDWCEQPSRTGRKTSRTVPFIVRFMQRSGKSAAEVGKHLASKELVPLEVRNTSDPDSPEARWRFILLNAMNRTKRRVVTKRL